MLFKITSTKFNTTNISKYIVLTASQTNRFVLSIVVHDTYGSCYTIINVHFKITYIFELSSKFFP